MELERLSSGSLFVRKARTTSRYIAVFTLGEGADIFTLGTRARCLRASRTRPRTIVKHATEYGYTFKTCVRERVSPPCREQPRPKFPHVFILSASQLVFTIVLESNVYEILADPTRQRTWVG